MISIETDVNGRYINRHGNDWYRNRHYKPIERHNKVATERHYKGSYRNRRVISWYRNR